MTWVSYALCSGDYDALCGCTVNGCGPGNFNADGWCYVPCGAGCGDIQQTSDGWFDFPFLIKPIKFTFHLCIYKIKQLSTLRQLWNTIDLAIEAKVTLFMDKFRCYSYAACAA